MKIKVIKKSIKEGIGKNDKPYCFKTLFVSVGSAEDANSIAQKLTKEGADKDKIEKFIKKNDYNGNISYQFNIGCSSKAFDLVGRYGVLDVELENLDFEIGEKFTNCKIKIIDKVEQIDKYEASSFVDEDDVVGFNFAPEPVGDGSHAEPIPIFDPNTLDPNKVSDLPF